MDKDSKKADVYRSFNMHQALCQTLYICKLVWLNEVMHIKCLAQDSRNGNDNDDEETDEESLGQISLVHLTGRTEWPVRFQEGGGSGMKGRSGARGGKPEAHKTQGVNSIQKVKMRAPWEAQSG